jgi:hypothetical protein
MYCQLCLNTPKWLLLLDIDSRQPSTSNKKIQIHISTLRVLANGLASKANLTVRSQEVLRSQAKP